MKGWQLVKKASKGKIKEGSFIEVKRNGKQTIVILFSNGMLKWLNGTFDTGLLCDNSVKFEVQKGGIKI